jgi:hypothetical protein
LQQETYKFRAKPSSRVNAQKISVKPVIMAYFSGKNAQFALKSLNPAREHPLDMGFLQT